MKFTILARIVLIPYIAVSPASCLIAFCIASANLVKNEY